MPLFQNESSSKLLLWIHAAKTIVDSAEWFRSPENIKGANRNVKIYVGRSTTVMKKNGFRVAHYVRIPSANKETLSPGLLTSLFVH